MTCVPWQLLLCCALCLWVTDQSQFLSWLLLLRRHSDARRVPPATRQVTVYIICAEKKHILSSSSIISMIRFIERRK